MHNLNDDFFVVEGVVSTKEPRFRRVARAVAYRCVCYRYPVIVGETGDGGVVYVDR